ncbi:hypothetical protein Lalb_Chr10g0092691 [Lupinus albus]|uniref:Uncharacterized protein n=1 Tax=Lupinus albus TaxID=3870 RepID=A0A6A4PUE9_LUPAL|nr:hypothetical protein Lalb_Chr10g0092691 [Lupinus albus]
MHIYIYSCCSIVKENHSLLKKKKKVVCEVEGIMEEMKTMVVIMEVVEMG